MLKCMFHLTKGVFVLMCGICGFIGNDKSFSRELLVSMNKAIHHRGPDEDGYYYENGIGLAMKRLSILDLGSGTQPIFNEDKSICIVFNGEIYNYKELRKKLISKGHSFTTNSDTEVIIHLYEEHGEHLVHHLRGMFAFAIYDDNTNTTLIVRDRLGIKPLYYSAVNDNLIFGSEIKCILQSKIISKEIDWQALDSFLTFTYIPAPRSIFKNIQKLNPGHMILIKNKNVTIKKYWDIDFSKQDTHLKKHELKDFLNSELLDATKYHLVSDVPIGAFLSGGVDSSLVVAMMSQYTSNNVETFTASFSSNESPLDDERPYAKLLSEYYSLNYNEYDIKPNFKDIINDIVDAFDEPFADDSIIPTFYISKLASKKVKVALSGLGGDELFGGYNRHYGFFLSKYFSLIPTFLHKNVINPLIRLIPEPRNSSERIDHLKRFSESLSLSPALRYLGFVSSLPESERSKLYSDSTNQKINMELTSKVITDHFNNCGSDDILDCALYTDLKTYLPEDVLALSDRLSMWHSLEVRVPLVDHHLVELSAKIPRKHKVNVFGMKIILKEVAKSWIPESIIKHKKQGFESPMAAWLRGELKTYAESILNKDFIDGIGIFNYDYIKLKLDEHTSGKRKNNKILFSLIMFCLWYKKYID